MTEWKFSNPEIIQPNPSKNSEQEKKELQPEEKTSEVLDAAESQEVKKEIVLTLEQARVQLLIIEFLKNRRFSDKDLKKIENFPEEIIKTADVQQEAKKQLIFILENAFIVSENIDLALKISDKFCISREIILEEVPKICEDYISKAFTALALKISENFFIPKNIIQNIFNECFKKSIKNNEWLIACKIKSSFPENKEYQAVFAEFVKKQKQIVVCKDLPIQKRRDAFNALNGLIDAGVASIEKDFLEMADRESNKQDFIGLSEKDILDMVREYFKEEKYSIHRISIEDKWIKNSYINFPDQDIKIKFLNPAKELKDTVIYYQGRENSDAYDEISGAVSLRDVIERYRLKDNNSC